MGYVLLCEKKGILKSPKRKGENERDREKKKSQTKPNRNNIEQHSIITTCVFNII